ncbi:MAG: hypothetical protein ACOH5I_24145 [Oligoflexus sp.]
MDITAVEPSQIANSTSGHYLVFANIPLYSSEGTRISPLMQVNKFDGSDLFQVGQAMHIFTDPFVGHGQMK